MNKDCVTQQTYIYSSPSVDALKELIESIRKTFYTNTTLDDMFYTGVFCNIGTYANFFHDNYDMYCEIVPSILVDNDVSVEKRDGFIKETINRIMMGLDEKPDWMKIVEEDTTWSEYDDAPSTFLYLIPKDEKYKDLADKLLDFLYSPNMMVSLKNS